MTVGLFTSWLWLGFSSPHQAAAQSLIAVDCNDASQTLSDAIRFADPGDTIQVTGTCQETVTITTDRLTIDGQGSAIIDGGGFPVGSALAGVININGASGVHLTGLTVQNGPDGVLILRGASARLTDVTSRDNADEGLQVIENATATFSGTILSGNNGDDGIGVFRTSSLTLDNDSVVSVFNNGDDGISVFSSVSVSMTNSTVSLDNNGRLDPFGDGMQIIGMSSVSFFGTNTINVNQNTFRGIVLSNSSYLLVSDTGVVNLTNNGNDGIGIFNVSRFSLGTGTTLRSESNADTGIVVANSAIAFCSDDSTVTLLNNAVAPSFVSDNSQASPACLEPMIASQASPRQRTTPEPPGEEVDSY
ncbi:hypothetical protein C2W62_27925 [Candidatus Entotheonella serta]|nr:hypothetical protein C2W62_27925 [Candidatus Entotheonella serta]